MEQMEDDLRKCTDARGLAELREMLVASGHVRQTRFSRKGTERSAVSADEVSFQ